MRILIAGLWRYDIYEETLSQALSELGHTVIAHRHHHAASRAQEFLVSKGLLVNEQRIKHDLIKDVLRSKPDVVLLWRPTLIAPSAILELKQQTKVFVATYNNDCAWPDVSGPMESLKGELLWRRYRRCLPYTDLNFVYRPSDIERAKLSGSRATEVLMPTWNPDSIYSAMDGGATEEQYSSDVVFVGHYEDDGRQEVLCALQRSGLDVQVWGDSTWFRHSSKEFRKAFPSIRYAEGVTYSRVLKGAKVGLAFLSKRNRDVYTRRSFEIPANGVAMLSEYSHALDKIYGRQQGAMFFSNAREAVERAKLLVLDSQLRDALAKTGQEIALAGHSAQSRAQEFVAKVSFHMSD